MRDYCIYMEDNEVMIMYRNANGSFIQLVETQRVASMIQKSVIKILLLIINCRFREKSLIICLILYI